MITSDKFSPEVETKNISPLKENLPDFLTLTRIIIGLTILALSFIGKDAYMSVVILALIGGATDIFDGKAARRYLRKNKQSRLGKYDVETDNLLFFVLLPTLHFQK